MREMFTLKPLALLSVSGLLAVSAPVLADDWKHSRYSSDFGAKVENC